MKYLRFSCLADAKVEQIFIPTKYYSNKIHKDVEEHII